MEWREHFWTIVLSVVFTLLLWLWAESENRESHTYSTRITALAVGPDAENLRIRFMRPGGNAATTEGVEVALTLQGSRIALQRAESRLREVAIAISGLNDNTEPIIDLSPYLAQLPVFNDLGLSFVSVEPATVTARVDRFETRAIDIVPSFPGIRIEEYTVDPPKAEVTMSRTQWNLMNEIYSGRLLNVTVPSEALRDLIPGEFRRITGEVQLRREIQDVATLESPTDAVVINVKPRLVIDEIEMSVFVKIQMLPLEQSLYDVHIPEASQRIDRVKFTGDAEVIRRLRAQELRVFAIIDLSPEELARGIERKEFEISPLPPSVTVSFPGLPPGQRPTVPLQITHREDQDEPSTE